MTPKVIIPIKTHTEMQFYGLLCYLLISQNLKAKPKHLKRIGSADANGIMRLSHLKRIGVIQTISTTASLKTNCEIKAAPPPSQSIISDFLLSQTDGGYMSLYVPLLLEQSVIYCKRMFCLRNLHYQLCK